MSKENNVRLVFKKSGRTDYSRYSPLLSSLKSYVAIDKSLRLKTILRGSSVRHN